MSRFVAGTRQGPDVLNKVMMTIHSAEQSAILTRLLVGLFYFVEVGFERMR